MVLTTRIGEGVERGGMHKVFELNGCRATISRLVHARSHHHHHHHPMGGVVVCGKLDFFSVVSLRKWFFH